MLPDPETVRQQWSRRYPDIDTQAMRIAELVKRVNVQLEGALEPLHDDVPLTAAEVELLIPLRHTEGPVIARRIAEHGHMSRAGVSKALGKLEKRGFVRRTPSPTDRRASLVAITDEGKEAVDRVFPQQVELESGLFAGLGENKDAVIEALESLAECLEPSRDRQ